MSAELITPAESVRLCELERVIQKGKDTFVEVGTALAEIRDSRIYRATFKTFEDYCQKRWEFTSRYVNNIIAASEVVSNLSGNENNCSQTKPTTESQARPLTKLPAEQQPAAWEKAQEIAAEEGKPIAARHVEAAVLEVMPKEEPEAVVVDGTQEEGKPTRERIPKFIPDDASRLWSLAYIHLQKILPTDKSRESVLTEIIEYAQKRITEKR